MTENQKQEKLSFREELHLQRWDDHRFYHHSRINQSLHLVSATCFLTCYALLWVDAAAAAMLGWFVAMCSRQIGHFFLEPKSYDEVNQATHEHKEEIKVGYNLHRKRVLQGIWAVSPLVLYLNPSFLGLLTPHTNWDEFFQNLAILWIALAVTALLFRTVHLFFLQGVQTGLVWAMKIITDPFHDFKLYIKSPLYLRKGKLIAPMIHVTRGVEGKGEDREAIG